MGNISIILAALFCVGAPMGLISEVPAKTEVIQDQKEMGKDRVAAIRFAYENGEYNAFLSEMDAAFQNGNTNSLSEMRKKSPPLQVQEEMEAKLLKLQKEKGAALMGVIQDQDDSLIAKRVRASQANLLTAEQEKALSKLNSFIAMAPNTGANEDENTLISIDFEYEYKMFHANVATSEAEQMALRMEKMDKMSQASKNFTDASLKQAVGIGADTLDARLARNLDGLELNALLKEKPNNETTAKIHSILSLYQEKFSDLMKG